MSNQMTKPRVLAVTSGKGGTGKTNLAVNLALCLRLFSVEVMLLDADLGLGNVDVLLGLDIRHNLREVLREGWSLDRIVSEGPRGLKILPGSSGVEQLASLAGEELERFLRRVQDYCADMDFLVVDTAPGISPAVIGALLAADQTLLVTNPEPTALTDAYAVLKVLSGRADGAGVSVSVVMNQTGSKEEALGAFDRLRGAADRFLGFQISYLGSVVRDESVGEATRRQVAFLTHYAEAQCSRDVRKIAARLVSDARGGSADMGRFFRKIRDMVDE